MTVGSGRRSCLVGKYAIHSPLSFHKSHVQYGELCLTVFENVGLGLSIVLSRRNGVCCCMSELLLVLIFYLWN